MCSIKTLDILWPPNAIQKLMHLGYYFSQLLSINTASWLEKLCTVGVRVAIRPESQMLIAESVCQIFLGPARETILWQMVREKKKLYPGDFTVTYNKDQNQVIAIIGNSFQRWPLSKEHHSVRFQI